MRNDRRDDLTLRPVGVALAAVMAGLGAGKAAPVEARAHAPLEPPAQDTTYVVDPTNHPGFEEDPDMIVGPSEAVEPFANTQADLFNR
jgi:hypothetical protein